MRDLHKKKQRPVMQNRLKKTPKTRKPINYRGILTKAAKVVGGVALLSAVGCTGYGIYRFIAGTTFFKLERIEVNELKTLKRQEVIDLAGVREGDGMFGLRLRSIGEQIGKNPWVSKVEVRRYLPNTLSIRIAERRPVAVINMGYLYYLDGDGNVFKPLTEGDSLNFPVVTGIGEEDFARDPAGSKDALREVLDLIAHLKSRSDFRLDEVSEIHYGKGYGMTLFTAAGGVPVKLGSGDYSRKLDRLARIYKDLQTQISALEYIDLDYSDKIIVKKV
ncbi:FtsQ-type POTRA domain-containing protein [Geotalea sp. SG265]|uniref:cell division protein FtsQ/DivIB n=1 Tax=Geotalea sp. SG265 TaxID=2922867 RepID=UPI001FAF7769|nr:FtsQ-type POTRA domain-containing protein [Geotalea sp. SG265]